jgi:putative oxidoreductase
MEFRRAADGRIEMIRSRWLLFIFRVIVGGLFIWAGAMKIADPLDFAQTINNYRAFPHLFIFPIAVVLPWIEVLSGAGLIAGILKRSSALITTLLLAGFIALVGSALVRGIDTACGCFGALSRKADLSLMIMDAVFLLMAVAILFSGRRSETRN